jgi:selenide,water dikinase
LCDLPLISDPKVILGMENLDDAGVYRLTDDLAIIQTIDFFTPIVDDPYAFGQIAVANSLSDVYAKGGKPIVAMNIVCFPIGSMDISVLKNILRGGLDKMREARTTLVGGHSIDDAELKYGLSVTGIIHPKSLVTNSGAKAGDRVVLTKPLGTGIISTAIKGGAVGKPTLDSVTRCMASLNKKASEVMMEVGIHACTDITGFGFLGHASKVAQNSEVSIVVNSASVPFLSDTDMLARQGFCPGGLSRNRDFYSPRVDIADSVPSYMQDILFDPQTSGGLLIFAEEKKAGTLLNKLHEAGVAVAAVIGEVVSKPAGRVVVK